MSDILVVGAGDFGGEVAAWILGSPQVFPESALRGFLDDDRSQRPPDALGLEIVSSIADYRPGSDDVLIMGLADPATKEHVVSVLTSKGAQFGTFVHPSAIVALGAEIGVGTVMCPHSVVSVGATVGEFVTLNLSATIGHHATVGRFSSVMSHGDIMGHAVLSERVLVGSRGGVLPKVKVGADAIVGAGSTAMRHVLPRSTVVGVPAKRLEIPT
jgi:sugar O-acyltransferase (sialic acid O-acetyltransferase NeuD family)